MTYMIAEISNTIFSHHITDIEPWRKRLEHGRKMCEIIRSRTPLPKDGTDLLRDEYRLANIASLFSDESNECYDSICRAAGAAALAIVTQQRARATGDFGYIEFQEPGKEVRKIPVGEAVMDWHDWVNGFSLALIARDKQALSALCSYTSISACSVAVDTMDSFWPYYCTALSCLITDPESINIFIDKWETELHSAKITNPLFLEYCITPVIKLLRVLARSVSNLDEEHEQLQVNFNTVLKQVITAHQDYYQQEEPRDWKGIITLPATALAAFAYDKGIEVNISSAYTPAELISGNFPRSYSQSIYHYPERRIKSADEAHWLFNLDGFPADARNHQMFEKDNMLWVHYELTDAPGLPNAIAEFVLEEGGEMSGLNEYKEIKNIPPALDAGQLLHLAEEFADFDTEEVDDLPEQKYRIKSAIDCIDLIISRIPEKEDHVSEEKIHSNLGKAVYEAEPGRFTRERLQAYRSGLQRALDEVEQVYELNNNIDRAGPNQDEKTQQNIELDDAQLAAKQQAMISMELIRIQVMPILTQLAVDYEGELVAQLIPREDDYEKVFVGEAVELARLTYQQLWKENNGKIDMEFPSGLQSDIHCYPAPAGMLGEENELSYYFPQGYSAIASWLNPHRVWLCWKYVEPGEQSGLSFNGLVWIDDHWAWFPKPFKALANLVKKTQKIS